MNIDERIEALTMNLELTARDLEGMRQHMNEGFDRLTANIEALGSKVDALADQQASTSVKIDALADRQAFTSVKLDALADNCSSLVTITDNLVITVQAQQARIEHMERKVG